MTPKMRKAIEDARRPGESLKDWHQRTGIVEYVVMCQHGVVLAWMGCGPQWPTWVRDFCACQAEPGARTFYVTWEGVS